MSQVRTGTPTERRAWIVVGLLLSALAAVVAVVGARPAPAPVTVHGFVTIYGLGSFERPGDACAQPLFAGRAVTVFDDGGRVLGATTLSGHGTATDRWHSFAGGFADACRYAITVPGVSTVSDTYTVAVGTEPGHAVGFDREQVRNASIDVPYGHS